MQLIWAFKNMKWQKRAYVSAQAYDKYQIYLKGLVKR